MTIVRRAMNKKLTLLLPAIVLLAACQAGVSPTGTPQPTAPPQASGVAGIVADLVAAGVAAKAGSPFMSEPVGGDGRAMCIGKDTVQTYQFIDHEAALAVVKTIDPKDPSKIGSAIVEWTGTPRFWLRDNVIVLYTGTDAATDAALRAVLGQPFAEAEGGRMPLPGPDCQ